MMKYRLKVMTTLGMIEIDKVEVCVLILRWSTASTTTNAY